MGQPAAHLLSGGREGQDLLEGIPRVDLHDVSQHLLGAAGGEQWGRGEGQGEGLDMGLARELRVSGPCPALWLPGMLGW